jgi:hypothetical protein
VHGGIAGPTDSGLREVKVNNSRYARAPWISVKKLQSACTALPAARNSGAGPVILLAAGAHACLS